MKPPTLPTISKNALKTLTGLFTSGAKVTHLKIKQAAPHIKFVGIMIVDSTKKKSDLAPDLRYLVDRGMPVPQAAKLFDISLSYAYKMLRDFPTKK